MRVREGKEVSRAGAAGAREQPQTPVSIKVPFYGFTLPPSGS